MIGFFVFTCWCFHQQEVLEEYCLPLLVLSPTGTIK